jgi:hypothetical protein
LAALIFLLVISLAAMIVALLKGRYRIVGVAVLIYVITDAVIATSRDGSSTGPIVLPTILLYLVLMFGAMSEPEPGSWWARNRSAR